MSSKSLGKKIIGIIEGNEYDLIDKFWKLNKMSKKQQSKKRLKTQKEMILIAQQIIQIENIQDETNFYPYYVKFANAKVEWSEEIKEWYLSL